MLTCWSKARLIWPSLPTTLQRRPNRQKMMTKKKSPGHSTQAESAGLQCAAVSFRYVPEQPWIINDFTHTFPPGIILIKGASGCGKSTLLRLMDGYLSPATGTITTPLGVPATDREYQRRQLG